MESRLSEELVVLDKGYFSLSYERRQRRAGLNQGCGLSHQASLVAQIAKSSVAQSCPTLWDPMDCSTPGFPFPHHLPQFAQSMSIESVVPSNHCILCHPLLLLPSIFLSIRVFSNELALCIRGLTSPKLLTIFNIHRNFN